ncbi:19789_t:CDS:2 [Rhizophagus irregularis]|nr:19789_t:CDS:2 [Rhizophagus irregularis]
MTELSTNVFYRIIIGGKTFILSRSSILYDSPNLFTEYFIKKPLTDVWQDEIKILREQQNSQCLLNGHTSAFTIGFTTTLPPPPTSTKEISFDRDPYIFEVIARYLRGYTMSFPLPSSVNLPTGMNIESFHQHLLEDAIFFKLSRLQRLFTNQQTIPSPISNSNLTITNSLSNSPYYDPFMNDTKLDLILSNTPIDHLVMLDRKLRYKIKSAEYNVHPLVQFCTENVIWDISSNSWNFKFLQSKDLAKMTSFCKVFINSKFYKNVLPNQFGEVFFNGLMVTCVFKIDGVECNGLEVYNKFLNKSRQIYKSSTNISNGTNMNMNIPTSTSSTTPLTNGNIINNAMNISNNATEFQQQYWSIGVGGIIVPCWGEGITEYEWLSSGNERALINPNNIIREE